MAVEAHLLGPIFSSQFLPVMETPDPLESFGLIYGTQMRYGAVIPVTEDHLIPQAVKPAVRSVDSSVTFNGESNRNKDPALSVPPSHRKRFRENPVIVNSPAIPRQSFYMQCQKPCNDPIMFLGHDLSSNVLQQQLDVDRLIVHHVDRMRMEIEEKREMQRSRIMEAVKQRVMNRLRTKDEEIEKMTKLNIYLEEKVKSLYLENQIWRDLAQSNEATANALRSNLQQVIAAVERSRWDEATTAVAEEAQSWCGSSGGVEEEAQDKKRVRRIGKRRECKSCGEGEASVLVLPCRHLCLCTLCGSSLHKCPICDSPRNASVHVNLSS